MCYEKAEEETPSPKHVGGLQAWLSKVPKAQPKARLHQTPLLTAGDEEARRLARASTRHPGWDTWGVARNGEGHSHFTLFLSVWSDLSLRQQGEQGPLSSRDLETRHELSLSPLEDISSEAPLS